MPRQGRIVFDDRHAAAAIAFIQPRFLNESAVFFPAALDELPCLSQHIPLLRISRFPAANAPQADFTPSPVRMPLPAFLSREAFFIMPPL